MNCKLYLTWLYKRYNIAQKLVIRLICDRSLLLTTTILNIMLIMPLTIRFSIKKLIARLNVLALCFVSVICVAQQAENENAESVQKIAAVEGEKKPSKVITEDELIRLESTFIGDKEQPSVSYFIPWKGTDSPDGLKWKIERKNDDTLNLVDRDIMLRSMNIYNEMQLE